MSTKSLRTRPSEPSCLENAKRSKDLATQVTGRSPTSPAARLEQNADVVLAAVARTRMPEHLRADLIAFLRAAFEQIRRRRESAESARRTRSRNVRASIIDALGVLPPDGRGVAGMVYRRMARRCKEGKTPPSMTTIYRTLREQAVKISSHFDAEVKPSTARDVVASTPNPQQS